MNHLMLKHGVYDGPFLTNIEVQKQNIARIQITETIPLNPAPPGDSVIAHMGIEVPKENIVNHLNFRANRK